MPPCGCIGCSKLTDFILKAVGFKIKAYSLTGSLSSLDTSGLDFSSLASVLAKTELLVGAGFIPKNERCSHFFVSSFLENIFVSSYVFKIQLRYSVKTLKLCFLLSGTILVW